MFDTLSDRLTLTIRKLTGQGRLTEANIQESLREVRSALLEADVALEVVKQFINDVQQKSIGEDIKANVRPGEALVKLVKDEIVHILGDACEELNFKTTPPAVILVAGLQGSGKTTTVAKLAKLIKREHNKKVMVVSTDVNRPAAILQLQTLAEQVEVNYFPSSTDQKPTAIARNALQQAQKQMQDVLIVDTAGRLHIDDDMMQEIIEVHQTLAPIETLFVVDSMTGQDAAITAKAFHEALDLTGVVLTKTDGDARGGAAFSIRYITGKPIKFIGTGEKTDEFESFHPDRIASRILGMGDILSLVEEAERKVDKKKAEKLAKKFRKGKAFDLEDFLTQLQQMRNMGGISSLLGKLPGMGQMPKGAMGMVSDDKFTKMEAIINSMTPQERHFPALIKGSRKKRIANGSGTRVQEINQMLKQFTQMQKMMKKLKGGGMAKMMKKMQGMVPPDDMPF